VLLVVIQKVGSKSAEPSMPRSPLCPASTSSMSLDDVLSYPAKSRGWSVTRYRLIAVIKL
jgi:hypothetical protein